MPLQRRVPKRGFKNPFRKDYAVVNIRDLTVFEKGAVVDTAALVAAGLVKGGRNGVKLLGQGQIDFPLVVKVDRCSDAARKSIETAGGQVELT
jgi:large subunit ribosomal protein L15